MILLDVNVLVYAHREDAGDHGRYRDWLSSVLLNPSPFGVSELVLSGFLRVVTHPRVFLQPTPLARAIEFTNAVRAQPNCVLVSPGAGHWEHFTRLCLAAGAKGNLIADAYHAALAVETGSEWITTDRGFARWPGLNWRHPFD